MEGSERKKREATERSEEDNVIERRDYQSKCRSTG